MRKIILWLRSLIFNISFMMWTLVPPLLFVWVVFLPMNYVTAVVRVWQRGATWLSKVLVGIHYRIEGEENIPQGACIIAAKHQSAWETCLLHVLFHDPAIVLKKELTYVPVWGWLAKATGLIPIDRKGGVRSLAIMKKAASDAVKAGRKIVIFPQGTRVRPGLKKAYKVGVVAMYQDLDIPIVPLALNSGLFWPKGCFIKTPGTITLRFLPPIPVGLSRSQVMRRLQHDIETHSDMLAALPVQEENVS